MARRKAAKWLKPFGVDFDLATGEMLRPRRTVSRPASAMRGHYADAEALERLIRKRGDPLHYEVFETPVPETAGHLMYCISKIQPGRVGDEYFMTKGHYHAAAGTAEVYLGLRGRGIVLMKTPDGRCVAEKIARGRMVYVPPFWAHRTANTGREPLLFFCVYPADAGHNYGDIETEGFPKRVVCRGGRVRIVPARRRGVRA
jgi:glucose-6-phosphate isomerase